jgi:uncharacterized phage-associated protein
MEYMPEMTTRKAMSVAKKLVMLSQESNNTLTPMQLIKLVYLCQGWMLGLYGRQLFTDEVEAWQYGPVIRDVYQHVKAYKSGPVDFDEFSSVSDDCNFDEDEALVIDGVYNQYSHLSGVQLSTLTHQLGTPWSLTWESSGKNASVSNDLIEHHYKTLMNKRQAA